ncbi:RDD family protein [Streptomyces sp. RB6PN25]|uniref:RDD family protein n=2 Tax=Streptomyces humicola TaxID=2953240 RepID=A0ABT1Q1M1_9ACTN|nr:RDD family protein [Streptomyces humicola]MCQ4083833.1 RDD family protein [Streptomyces humicola]
MSAPSPVPGYYADPSIPGYVRYWNGSAWVPGTSRPEPKPGEVLTPPAVAESGAGAGGGPAVAPQAPPRTPAVEESGPMFLDEDPQAPVAESPQAQAPAKQAQPQSPRAGAAGWNADPAQQGGVGEEARRVSWGHPGEDQGDQVGGYGYPRQAPPAAGYGYPQAAPAVQPVQPAQADPVPWPQQVQQLAGAPGQGGGDPDRAIPWRPPVASNPFLQAQESARPAPLGRRFAARLLDSLLVGALVTAVAFPLVTASVRHIENKIDAARLSGENVQVWLIDGTTGPYLAVVIAALLVAGVLYEALPTAKWGRTLGKKLFKLQVLDIESQLPPGFGQAFRRMLVRQLLDVVVVGVVNVVWCLFDRPWRQCWHDKAARTFVAGEN